MNKSIFFFWFAAIFMTALIFSSQAYSETLVFNTQDFPPFSYKVEGKVKGPAVEIIKAVCKKINVTCSFRLLPWTRAQNYVKEGKSNAMFVIGWNKARDAWLYFSPPIMKTEYGFFVKDDNPLEFKDASDVKGYKIGVYGPSNTSRSLEKIKAKADGLTIDLRPDDESGFKKLSGGRVDAVFSNRDVGFAIIKKIHLGNIRYAGKQRELNYYIGFSKKFNEKQVVDKFNNKFMELYKNGSIKKILDKYFLEPAVIK
ncbi:MAG: amino acid ABC transporter substrate-binding protein [Deltaproteobacteria bacterium]|nr:amino acid ABC transporter substrate-binding protein [Deltaproteobacteria bacterium]